jgi:hypothetical protein
MKTVIRLAITVLGLKFEWTISKKAPNEIKPGIREIKPGIREIKPGIREIKPGIREIKE